MLALDSALTKLVAGNAFLLPWQASTIASRDDVGDPRLSSLPNQSAVGHQARPKPRNSVFARLSYADVTQVCGSAVNLFPNLLHDMNIGALLYVLGSV